MLSVGLPPVKFLIVDDREENLFALGEILRRDGLHIISARSGHQALEALLVHDVALAIIDVHMPELDGVALAELMRGSERTQHVPIILVTAGAHEKSRLFRGYEAGAVDFLYKPIEPVVLRNKAQTFFDLYRQKQQLARQLELLREGEEFRRRLFDASQDQMLVLDPDGSITWGNAAAVRSWARQAKSLTSSRWDDLWLAEHRELALSHLADARTDRVARFVGALRGQGNDDHGETWCDVVLAPIHDARGRVDRVLAIARDITEQRKVTAERERLTSQLEETLRLNELFVAAVGHDLRNPLLAVVAGSELIVRRSSDPDAVRLAETMREGGKRMQRMTGALFDLTRARLGGGIPIERAPLDLRALAERVFREHQLSAPGQPMSLAMDADVRGEWDGTRLEQLLSNLLGNAVQHGERGAPIRVELSCDEREVVLSVHNAGVITEAALQDLFDPFRARNEGRRSDGLGLGLYIVQQIALAHSGRVEVCSTAEHGTIFRVQLPRV
ncbi:MAG: response regulator [Polyangiaceae bacterium]